MDIDRDIDFARKTVTVRGAVRFDGNQPTITGGKTAYSKRVIPLLNPLAEFLAGKHGLVLPGEMGKPCSETMFRHRWESFKKAADIPGVRVHDFRHNYTVWLFDCGVDMKTAQAWLGHADASMIMKVYDHLSENRQKTGAQNIENMLF